MEKYDRYKKYTRFSYYLRQCRICNEIFKAYSLNGRRPKTRLCPDCKDKINNQRLKTIMKTKLKLKEIRENVLK
jgi:hypothetical protein